MIVPGIDPHTFREGDKLWSISTHDSCCFWLWRAVCTTHSVVNSDPYINTDADHSSTWTSRRSASTCFRQIINISYSRNPKQTLSSDCSCAKVGAGSCRRNTTPSVTFHSTLSKRTVQLSQRACERLFPHHNPSVLFMSPSCCTSAISSNPWWRDQYGFPGPITQKLEANVLSYFLITWVPCGNK